MPGVIVETSPRGGAGAPLRAPSGTWFAAGITERGDLTAAVECRGMADFLRKLGDPVPYGTLYDQAMTFFREGGARLFVSRIVGPAATVGTAALKDTALVNTLRLDAASPGGWSSRLTFEVAAGNDPNTVRVIVSLDGSAVEDKDNLGSPDAVVAAFATSVYARFTNLGSATAAPGNLPAVSAPAALTTQGVDDRASITDAIRVAALARLGKDLGDGAVSIPGATSDAIKAGIRAHCVATDRIGITAAARGATAATLKATAQSYGSTLGSEYLGMFAPWVLIPDGAGGSKAVSPEGFVAACRNRAHEADGPWRVPAGDVLGVGRYIVGVDAPFDDDTADDLDGARVSVIRQFDNLPELFGWRSLSSDETDYYWLKNRDMLNFVSVQARKILRAELFKNVDGRGHLLSAVNADLVGLLEPIRAAGGIFERTDGQTLLDPGYLVDTGEDVNPVESLQTQTVNAAVFLRPSPAANLIKLTITEVALTAAV